VQCVSQVKVPEREGNYAPTSSAEVKKDGAIPLLAISLDGATIAET